MELKKETEVLKNSTILVGYVSSNVSLANIPIVVAAYQKKGSERKIMHYAVLNGTGGYELIVPKGDYRIVAYADKNRNLIYEKEEAIGQYREESLSVPSGGVIKELNIMISNPPAQSIDFPAGTLIPSQKTHPYHCSSPGVITDLDDPIFSEEYARKAYWNPLAFFREIGGNIYFLEPYDPNKIPILFIHGAAGSPRNWKPFIASLDRDRFQFWFYYYPSGATIGAMSHLLFWKLYTLQHKYKFTELCITAHSMGGLVARSFIVNFIDAFSFDATFISISTPWGGESLAADGVKYAPAAIPAWNDMQPDSEFIKSIFRKKMLQTIDYYLFFGHKGNRNPLRPNNDKAVTMESMLDIRSQKEAKMVYGFNEDHESILASEQVLSQYAAILSESHTKTKHSAETYGNRLRVLFSFDFPKDLPKPRAILYLRPVNKKGSETWLYLNFNESGHIYGPFTPGEYRVTLIAPAFYPEPSTIPVTIGKGVVPSVTFSMKPKGCLTGRIVNSDNHIRQAGMYLDSDKNVKIQSITLRGKGITRILKPSRKTNDNHFVDLYLSETDYTTDGYFCFYGLPGGAYELVIQAKGYETYSEICHVRPGFFENEKQIELVKKDRESP